MYLIEIVEINCGYESSQLLLTNAASYEEALLEANSIASSERGESVELDQGYDFGDGLICFVGSIRVVPQEEENILIKYLPVK